MILSSRITYKIKASDGQRIVLQLLASGDPHIHHLIKRKKKLLGYLSQSCFPLSQFHIGPILSRDKPFVLLFSNTKCHNQCLSFLNVLRLISATSASLGVWDWLSEIKCFCEVPVRSPFLPQVGEASMATSK